MRGLPITHEDARPDSLDLWNDEDFVLFSDNIEHHPVSIARTMGKSLEEVIYLWYRTVWDFLDELPPFAQREHEWLEKHSEMADLTMQSQK